MHERNNTCSYFIKLQKTFEVLLFLEVIFLD